MMSRPGAGDVVQPQSHRFGAGYVTFGQVRLRGAGDVPMMGCVKGAAMAEVTSAPVVLHWSVHWAGNTNEHECASGPVMVVLNVAAQTASGGAAELRGCIQHCTVLRLPAPRAAGARPSQTQVSAGDFHRQLSGVHGSCAAWLPSSSRPAAGARWPPITCTVPCVNNNNHEKKKKKKKSHGVTNMHFHAAANLACAVVRVASRQQEEAIAGAAHLRAAPGARAVRGTILGVSASFVKKR